MTKIDDIRSQTQRTNGTRKLSAVTHIVRHHSGTTTGNILTFWRYWNGTRGWGTGGYHEIILRDGTVQLCYDPNEITNGVGGANNYCYHICVVGNGSFTEAQEKAWDERVAYNMDRLNISVDNVKGHREMPNASTTCPGISMDAVRNRIKGAVEKPASKPSKPSIGKKSISQMADEVIAQKHGNGHDNRRKSLGISAAEYEKVRAEVNRKSGLGSSKPAPAKPKKSIAQMATEVINNQHGNGHDNRRRSLGISQAEYEKVRAEVNRRAGGGTKSPAKSIDQMAREVIAGKHGNGLRRVGSH
ncbi:MULTISPECIES: N-acetylmuramoyl-L-alanine amidase [Bacillaceae]|uniref:N-acetylmuramoyl-L-alanine amidase n=1 Tax=Shouchella oshimensis TaxID=290588 RepID=UPI0006EC09DC|nr:MULTISPECIES: N-acetylmuramoyl-L-alanine amidase [Bacillaceae]